MRPVKEFLTVAKMQSPAGNRRPTHPPAQVRTERADARASEELGPHPSKRYSRPGDNDVASHRGELNASGHPTASGARGRENGAAQRSGECWPPRLKGDPAHAPRTAVDRALCSSEHYMSTNDILPGSERLVPTIETARWLVYLQDAVLRSRFSYVGGRKAAMRAAKRAAPSSQGGMFRRPEG